MPHSEVMEAVESRFGTEDADEILMWQPPTPNGNGDPVLPVRVYRPNETSDTPQDNFFLWISYPVADEVQISLGDPGNNLWRETGVVRIELGTPRNIKTKVAGDWLKVIADLFRGQSFDQGHGRFWGVSPSGMDARNEEAGYYRTAIQVGYEHDIYG